MTEEVKPKYKCNFCGKVSLTLQEANDHLYIEHEKECKKKPILTLGLKLWKLSKGIKDV